MSLAPPPRYASVPEGQDGRIRLLLGIHCSRFSFNHRPQRVEDVEVGDEPFLVQDQRLPLAVLEARLGFAGRDHEHGKTVFSRPAVSSSDDGEGVLQQHRVFNKGQEQVIQHLYKDKMNSGIE